MKKTLKLDELAVKSFVTDVKQVEVHGGGTTNRACPTAYACPTEYPVCIDESAHPYYC